MIISHKYKFIFIKTTKTAGTSIEVFLSQCCGKGDIVTPVYPSVEQHFAINHKGIWNPLPEIIENKGRGVRSLLSDLLSQRKYYNHIKARTVRARVSHEIWDSYFKFCVERNPWDKTLSQYHMLSDRAKGNMTLDQYLNGKQFCLNYPKYTDANGHVIVDRVIKYESLMEDLSQVFNKLGVPFDGTLGVRAKSEHRRDRDPYQNVLTNEQRTIIEDAFAKEIEIHGYVY